MKSKIIASVAAVCALTSALAVTPASASGYCGAGYIKDFGVNVRGPNQPTNFYMQLDFSLKQPDSNMVYGGLIWGQKYVIVKWDDSARYPTALATARAAFLAGIPVRVYASGTNDCVLNSGEANIQICSTEDLCKAGSGTPYKSN